MVEVSEATHCHEIGYPDRNQIEELLWSPAAALSAALVGRVCSFATSLACTRAIASLICVGTGPNECNE